MGSNRTGAHGDRGPTEHLTVAEAAEALGISREAVRMRVRRGTLRSERREGTLYVLLDADRTRPHADRTGDRTGDRTADQAELVAALRDALEAEREANRENRRIIAMMAQRIPELEPPADQAREARGSPEAATEGEGGGAHRPGTEGPQDAPRRRSWWREFFGFD